MTYKEKQKEWIKSNKIKIGSEVIIGRYDGFAEGWIGNWVNPHMDLTSGKVGKVVGIKGSIGISVETEISTRYWNYPYFVLDPRVVQEEIEEPIKRENWFLLD